MPSARATALTQRHRAELGRVAAIATRQAATVVRGADPVDIDDWWDTSAAAALLRIVTLGFSTTVTLALRWLRQHAALEGVSLDPVRAVPNREQMATSLRVTGPVAFKTNLRSTGNVNVALQVMQARLAGSVQRLTLSGDRETTQNTIDTSRAIVGYRRVLQGDACAWCAMLASRGAVYKEASATQVVGRSGLTRGSREIGSSYHDHCHCTSEPLYVGEPEPDDVVALRDQWEETTAGLSGKDALNAFRRARSASPADS